jgi:hypothetical protein
MLYVIANCPLFKRQNANGRDETSAMRFKWRLSEDERTDYWRREQVLLKGDSRQLLRGVIRVAGKSLNFVTRLCH